MSQFSGLRVLELASVLAGPSVGQFFAELGAEVIKVENLKANGDVTRTWKSAGEQTDDRSAYFCSVNWGKQSIAIDLSRSAGQEIVHKLAAQTDIVIASFKPGDAEKLHVDYQTLSQMNPAIIYGQVSGYGSKDPRVGYDAIIQAEAGFMFMNGEPGGESLKMPVALIDVIAGHHLKEGLLLAMLEKLKTGRGRLVEVSLIAAAVSSLVNQATNWLINKKVPQKQGSAHPNIAPYGDIFRTKDGKEMILAVGSDQQFSALCNILALEPVSQDVDFQTNPARVKNRDLLKTILNNRISDYNSAELMNLLAQKNIPAGLVQNVKEALEMEQINNLKISKNGIQGILSAATEFNHIETSHFLPPPHFGEHTDLVLKKFLDFDSEKLVRLRFDGVIR